MLDAAAAVLPVILIALLTLNLGQRSRTRPPPPPKSAQREASLLAAGLALALLGMVLALQRVRAPDWAFLPVLGVVSAAALALRRRFAVFARHCPTCGRRLPVREVLFGAPEAGGSAPSSDDCPTCR